MFRCRCGQTSPRLTPQACESGSPPPEEAGDGRGVGVPALAGGIGARDQGVSGHPGPITRVYRARGAGEGRLPELRWGWHLRRDGNTAATARPTTPPGTCMTGQDVPPPAKPKLSAKERQAREADRLMAIRLRVMIGRELENRGIEDPAEIGAAQEHWSGRLPPSSPQPSGSPGRDRLLRHPPRCGRREACRSSAPSPFHRAGA